MIGDVRRAAAADWRRLVERSGGPVDWSEWQFITPQIADAYNGYLNDVVLTAAVLEPPSFDPAADDAVNYGAVGWLIGHELTHGFDDWGRTFDSTAALRNWWTPEDAEAFQARANNWARSMHTSSQYPVSTSTPDRPWARTSLIWVGC